MFRDLLEYAEWYYYEEDYFISEQGILLTKFPDDEEYTKVKGFRFYIWISYETQVKPYDAGGPIVTTPRDITPIYDWGN